MQGKNIFLLLLAVVFAGVFCTGFVSDKSRVEYVDFSTDKIPTLYTVVGERQLIYHSLSTWQDSLMEVFVYGQDAVSDKDLEKHTQALIDDRFYRLSEDNDKTKFCKEYEDYLLIVEYSNFNENSVQITYHKYLGQLVPVILKRVFQMKCYYSTATILFAAHSGNCGREGIIEHITGAAQIYIISVRAFSFSAADAVIRIQKREAMSPRKE